jgi:hypothetical protein
MTNTEATGAGVRKVRQLTIDSPVRRKVRRRVLRTSTAGVVAATALTVFLPIGTAKAEGLGPSFTASASGNLMLTSFTVSPAVVFDKLLDPGSALAQASVSSVGDARGYASSTSPGATFDALGGVVGTATGGQVGEGQIPKNPAAVRSLYPTIPEQSRSVGSVVLSSRSQSTGTVASSSDGSNTGTALASVDRTAGTMIAQSETTVQNIVVSPLLSLNGVRSAARAERTADGAITLSSSFAITSITVNGATVAVGKRGLDVNGQQQSFDPATAVLRPVLDQLASQGITVEIFPGQKLKSSVQSAGVRVTLRLTAPPVGALDGATVTYTFGGSYAALDSAGAGESPLTVGPPAIGAGPVGAGGASLTGTAAPPSDGLGVTDRLAAGGADGAPAVAPAPLASSALRLPLDASSTRLYPVLLLAGAALFAASRLFRPITGGTA